MRTGFLASLGILVTSATLAFSQVPSGYYPSSAAMPGYGYYPPYAAAPGYGYYYYPGQPCPPAYGGYYPVLPPVTEPMRPAPRPTPADKGAPPAGTTPPRTAPGTAPGTTPGTTPSTTPSTTPDTTAQAGATPGETAGASAGEAGSGELGSASATMFGDLLAAQTCGPLYATLSNGQKILIDRGVPLSASVQNAIVNLSRSSSAPTVTFNFDIALPDGRTLPANAPITRATVLALSPAERQFLLTTFLQQPVPFSACGGNIVALVARGAFKISDNESPMPQDRVFALYNFFDQVNGSAGSGVPQTNVHREVAGFESTFMCGYASFGLRAPIIQVQGDPAVARDDFGDLTFIVKYALYMDRNCGDVLSMGLVTTAPTGANFLPAGTPDIHPWLFQPFVGGISTCGRFFIIAFSSIVVPTDSRDVVFLSNDVSIGYNICNIPFSFISSIAPTVEGHLTTPLNHRGSQTDPVGLPDIFDMTFGARIGLGDCASLGLGVVIPVTGPRPFDYELQTQFTVRF